MRDMRAKRPALHLITDTGGHLLDRDIESDDEARARRVHLRRERRARLEAAHQAARRQLWTKIAGLSAVTICACALFGLRIWAG